MRHKLALVLTVLILGCVSGANVRARFDPQPQARSFPPVPAAQVKRYWGPDTEHLPQGVTLVGRPEAPTGVAVERDFPSPADPHALLGALSLGTEELPGHAAEREALLAEQVGQRGGNAYVELPQRSSVLRLMVLHLSAAAAAPAYPPAATLLAEPAPELAAYQASGAPETRHLDDFSPLLIDGKRGTCYAVRAALDGGALLNARARRALSLKVASPAVRLVDGKAPPLRRDAAVGVRTATAIIGCPLADGPIPVAFNVGFDSSRPDAGAALGTGDVQLQVYARSVADDELGRRSAAQEAAGQAADDEQRSQFRKSQCLSCNGQLSQCAPGTDPASCGPFRECLLRLGMSAEDCVR